MKKKSLLLLTVAAMALALTACGGGESAGNDTTTAAQSNEATSTQADGYVFDVNGTSIAMNVPAADIIAALGEPQDKYEAESCAFQGMDRTYTYAGYTLDTYENNGVETTLYVTFKDDTVATKEGLAIGESLDKAKELYGTGTENSGSIVFTKGSSTLTVFYDADNVITEIQYAAITE